MNNLDFTFESSAWEEYIDGAGTSVSAAQLLTLLEGESEQNFEDCMLLLEQRGIALDVSDLPRPTGGEAAVRLRKEEQLAKKGFTPGELEEGDPLRLYLEEVAMTPAFGDAQLLAEELAAGNRSVMEQLTNLSLSRVIELARGYTGRGVLLMDLIQEGSLGLWQAVQSYTGGEFAPWRDRWIHFCLARAVLIQAKESGLGQKMRTALEDYRSVDERLLAELGRNPTLEEIAEALHMTPDAAAVIRKNLDNARILARAKKQPEPEEEEIAETQAVEDTAYFQMRQRIQEMLSGLSEQEIQVISLRFGLEGGLPMSPEDTGRKLNLTRDEVVAIEAAAMIKMRSK